jgi:hypothetical protein
MKKKIVGQCPCGYCFETAGENFAVAMIQLHVEEFHKDLLPFGITEKEALSLLKVDYSPDREKFSPDHYYWHKPDQLPSAAAPKTAHEEDHRKHHAQLLEQPA